MLLIDIVGKPLSDRWNSRHVLVAGGDDNAGRAVLLVRCLHDVVVTVTSQGLHRRLLAHGQVGGALLEQRHDLGGRGEAFGCDVAEYVVHVAGRVEPERIPTLRAPCRADAIAFQDDMLDVAGAKRATHRNPGRPSSYKDAVDTHFHRSRLPDGDVGEAERVCVSDITDLHDDAVNVSDIREDRGLAPPRRTDDRPRTSPSRSAGDRSRFDARGSR